METLDVVEQISPGGVQRGVDLAMNAFSLEHSEEAFAGRVVAAMPGQGGHVHRAVARLGQALGDLAQFRRRAGQAVDQQDPDRTFTENETGITFTEVDLDVVHRLVARTSSCSSSFKPRSISG